MVTKWYYTFNGKFCLSFCIVSLKCLLCLPLNFGIVQVLSFPFIVLWILGSMSLFFVNMFCVMFLVNIKHC